MPKSAEVSAVDPPGKRRIRRLVRGLIISAVTFAILIVILEIGVRVLVPESTFSPLANVFVRHENPAISFTIRPGYVGQAFGVPLHGNRHGFRGREWAEHKPENTVRIAVIGDSHSFAYGVEFERGVGEQLARRLQADLRSGSSKTGRTVEVLNFSLPGYNSRQECAVFHEVALRFAPDLVLVVYCSNDDQQTFWCDDDGWLYSRLAGENALVKNDSWRERSFIRFEKSLLGNSRLLLWARIQWLRYRDSQHHQSNMTRYSATDPLLATKAEIDGVVLSDEFKQAVHEPLRSIARTCRQKEIPIVFASITGGARGAVLLGELNREFGVPIVDLTSVFPEVKSYLQLMKEFSLGWDSHLDARAHARWADAFVEAIRVHRLLGDGR
jgi:hypothetical protein